MTAPQSRRNRAAIVPLSGLQIFHAHGNNDIAMSDIITQLAHLKSSDIRERLAKLHADEKALRVLLRAAIQRERHAGRLAAMPRESEVSRAE